MMERINFFLWVTVFCVFVACNSTDHGKHEQKEALEAGFFPGWVNDPENGLIAEEKINGISYAFHYKPLAYEAMIHAMSDTGITRSGYEEQLNRLKYIQYASLNIKSLDNEGELLRSGTTHNDEYYRRLEYCSFDIQHDIKLVDGADTLPCILHHFEKAFGISPEAVLALAFEVKDSLYTSRAKTLIFEDNLFKNGTIRLQVSEQAMKNVPDVKITN